MKTYEDVKKRAKGADPELQMLLNEVTLGRNIAEMTTGGFKKDVTFATVPVMVDGNVIFRTAVYEKTVDDNRDILAEVASGKTYSDKCVIIGDDSAFLALTRKQTKETEEE